jgi:DNA repair exonuclease SbcCD ATPase subunit
LQADNETLTDVKKRLEEQLAEETRARPSTPEVTRLRTHLGRRWRLLETQGIKLKEQERDLKSQTDTITILQRQLDRLQRNSNSNTGQAYETQMVALKDKEEELKSSLLDMRNLKSLHDRKMKELDRAQAQIEEQKISIEEKRKTIMDLQQSARKTEELQELLKETTNKLEQKNQDLKTLKEVQSAREKELMELIQTRNHIFAASNATTTPDVALFLDYPNSQYSNSQYLVDRADRGLTELDSDIRLLEGGVENNLLTTYQPLGGSDLNFDVPNIDPVLHQDIDQTIVLAQLVIGKARQWLERKQPEKKESDTNVDADEVNESDEKKVLQYIALNEEKHLPELGKAVKKLGGFPPSGKVTDEQAAAEFDSAVMTVSLHELGELAKRVNWEKEDYASEYDRYEKEVNNSNKPRSNSFFARIYADKKAFTEKFIRNAQARPSTTTLLTREPSEEELKDQAKEIYFRQDNFIKPYLIKLIHTKVFKNPQRVEYLRLLLDRKNYNTAPSRPLLGPARQQKNPRDRKPSGHTPQTKRTRSLVIRTKKNRTSPG